MHREFVLLQTGTQAAAVASVLQEPADKFENDVCLSFCSLYFGINVFIIVDTV